MFVSVLSSNGIPLMPTSSYKARRLLKSGRAVIAKRTPVFTIRLLDREDGETQSVEYKCDTGYQHIGISVCSEKHEYVSTQYDMLLDETERHNDCRKYRRTRRNRLRYRKVRFNNRKGLIAKEGFAPSIRNKRDCHIRLFEAYAKVLPISKAIFEMGQFDTQLLKAVEEGKPIPQGEDYQHGERYGYETLRDAVFERDHHKCVVCHKEGILRIHHIGYRKGDRTNRMANLATVCTGCHTSKNHKEGGKLWDLKPITKGFKGATFMTTVRYDILNRIMELPVADGITVSMTYGAMTKLKRQELGVSKTHSNDAYSMGDFHPKHRTKEVHLLKRRRNNRILEKFYDAKYIDIRDGKNRSGSQLSCGRTNRKEARNSEKNERFYRGSKVSNGRRSIRRQRYALQPGDIVSYDHKKAEVVGIQNLGKYVKLTDGRVVPTGKVSIVKHAGGWKVAN